MGWAGPMPNAEGRMVGYAVEATCDADHCDAKIDRGLAYVCGGMHDGDEHGCGHYFCYKHLLMGVGLPAQLCTPCAEQYRKDYPEEVEAAIEEFHHRTKIARAKYGVST